MTFDFRASQVRTSKIILSGSATDSGARLLIYPIESQGSPLNQGQIDPTLFNTGSIGQDVFMYVSGVSGGRDGTSHGIVLLQGDLFSSGSLIAEQVVRASSMFATSLVDAPSVQATDFYGLGTPQFNFYVTGQRFNVLSNTGGITSIRSQGNIAISEGTIFSGTLSSSITANRLWQVPDASGDVALTNRVLAGPNITINTYATGYLAVTGTSFTVTGTSGVTVNSTSTTFFVTGTIPTPAYVPIGAYMVVNATQGTQSVGGSPGVIYSGSYVRSGFTTGWSFQVGASVTSGITGTIVLFDLSNTTTGAVISVTTTAACSPHSATLTPGSSSWYELRAYCTGATAADYLVINNATLTANWS